MQNNSGFSGSEHMNNEDVIDLRFLVGLLKAHKWFILCIAVTCMILGGGYSATRPAIYESSALIKVNGDSNGGASNLMAILGMTSGASSGGFMSASPAEVETSLIKSDYIMGDVVEKLGLDIQVRPKYLPIVGALRARLFSPADDQAALIHSFMLPQALQTKPFELTVENKAGGYVLYGPEHQTILHGNVGQLANSQDNSISINVSALPAKPGRTFIVTKQPTNIVAAQLSKNLMITEEGQKTGILSINYQANKPELAQQVLNTILQVAVEANIAEKAAEATKTLTFLQDQLPEVTKDLDTAENRLNNYRAQTGTVDETVEAELLLQEIVSAEKDLNELSLIKLELLEKFTSKHPEIIAVNDKQAALTQQLNEIKAQLRKLPLSVQGAANFQRDIKVHGEIYSGVMQNLQQMQMLKGSTVSSVRVLEMASFPTLPIASKTTLIILIGLIFGFFLATAVLLLQYSLSKTLDPLLIEKLLGVQVLAVVPYSLSQTKINREMRRSREQRKHALLSLEQPKDVAIEAMRSLRTALQLVSLSDNKKIIAISGCSPSVGKSFVSSNLASLLGDLNKKVLLIDADLRKGYLNKIFSIPQSPGLSEHLAGNLSIENCLHKVLPNVDLITTGEYPSHPSELLMNKKLGELIGQVSEQYDLVIIDTPPILAVTDASLIFKWVDIKLLLVGLGKDQLNEIQHTKNIFEKTGFSLDGIICNHLQKNEAKYYAGSYNYQYE